MGCVPAKLCQQALADATASFPARYRGNDGICGDEAHQARQSDHNTGDAFDLTHDPKNGCDAHGFAEQVKRERPAWVKYIISKGRIWNPSVSPDWRDRHKGPDDHFAHAHFSIVVAYRDVKVIFPWSPAHTSTPIPVEEKDDMQIVPNYAPDGALHYFYVSDTGDLSHAWWPRKEPYGRKSETLGDKGAFDGQPSVTVDSATDNKLHVVCDRKGTAPPAHLFYVPGKGWGAD